MASAEDSRVLIGFIFFNLCNHSSMVGCSAVFATSRTRYSLRDIPAVAARALSFRCKSSGTLRNWIITGMRSALHVEHMHTCVPHVAAMSHTVDALGFSKLEERCGRSDDPVSGFLLAAGDSHHVTGPEVGHGHKEQDDEPEQAGSYSHLGQARAVFYVHEEQDD